MHEKRIAMSVPYDFPLPEHAKVAQEMEERGYTDAWSQEVDGNDPFTPLAVVAQATNMRVGTAIANVYTRGPAALAHHAASMAEIASGRFVLGLGSGSQPIVESWNGLTFTRPATRVREMVTFLRQALTGERVVFEGRTFRVDGYRLTRPPVEPVPIHVAALREGMLRVAGEVADGVCVNWLSAEDVKQSVAVVREAAAAAGRDPAAIEVTARLMVSIDPPGEDAETHKRREIAAYMNVPVYKEFHRWLGRGPQFQGMWEHWDAGDRRGALAALPQQVVDDLLISGAPEERRAHVQRYLDSGVDTAFLAFKSGTKDPEVRRERTLQALRDHAPRQ